MKREKTRRSLTGISLSGLLAVISVCTARADYQSTVLSDTPLAYYPLNLDVDTGSTASDVSGNGNPGTYVNIYSGFNNVPGPSPYITNGVSLDGLTTYIDLSTGSNPGLLNFAGPITLEAWAQPTSPSQPLLNIIAKGYDPSSTDNEITLRANGGNYYGGTFSDTNGVQGATGGTQSTNWSHVVITHDGSVWRLYVDGSLVQANANSAGALNWPAPWRIGTGSASGANRIFNGNLSQVAMYNYGLSSNQVLNHFSVGKVGVAAASARPIITVQPQSQSNFIGGSVTFSVTAVSALPTTNQWFKNNNPINGQTSSSLTLNNVQPGDVANYRVVVGNNNGTTNSATAAFTLLTVGNLLQWIETGNSGVWDQGSSANWRNLGNNQQVPFTNNDQVLFDDTVGVPTSVTVNGTVAPSVMTVNSSVNNFTINSPGQITGTGSLVKKGSSTLNLFVPGGLAGPVTISGGLVYAGNNAFSAVASITITNNSTLDLAGGTFNGNKPITVSGTGVGGQGSIFNSYNDYPQQSVNITLAGDTTFGGSARWDLAAGSQITGAHALTLDWSAQGPGGYAEWNTPTIAANVLGITLTNGSKLGIKSMETSFQNPGTMLTVGTNGQAVIWNGGYNGSLHFLTGAQFVIYSDGLINGSNIIFENATEWDDYGGSTDEPINNAITLNGLVRFVIGDHNMVFTNLISGVGGFVSDAYNHQFVFSASNTYSGPTVIGNGPQVALTGNGSISHSALIFFGGNSPGSVHFDVTGRPDQTLTLASGQTLAGVGQINGKLTVSAGATLSPAGTNTTLGITTGQNTTGGIAATGDIGLAGTTVIKLNGSGTNDALISTAGNIICGGTLNLVNISGTPLAAGDSFQILYAGTISGSFAITPATPGPGLAWNTSQLGSGIISVVAGASHPAINNTFVSGGNLIFSGTNGTAGNTYYVLTSTDVTAPFSTWTPVQTNTFGPGGVFSVTNAINPATPKRFYLLKLQ
jgi:hypothetical protein